MRPIIEAWPSRRVKILGYQRWYAQPQPQEKSKALEIDQRNDFCLGKLMISRSLADTGQRCTSEINTMMQHQPASFRQPRQPESSLQTNSACSGAENAAMLPAASELAQLQPCANAANSAPGTQTSFPSSTLPHILSEDNRFQKTQLNPSQRHRT